MPSRSAPPLPHVGASSRPGRSRVDNPTSVAGTRFDLTGRVALVTGASRGLGAAMSRALALAGCDLILWARHWRTLKRQADLLTEGRATAVPQVLVDAVDVTDSQAVRRGVRRALERFGHIEILINNAGIWEGDDAQRLSRARWERVLATDLTAVFWVSQAVVPSMITRHYGKIINISSTSGVMALPQGAAYGSAKAALMHLTRILAVEWGPYGVRVVGIAPGLFRTDMTRDVFADRAWSQQRQAEIPLRRFGEPEDLEGLAVFLASSASDHITGQTIIIDGGASLTT